ncbi:NUDIX domain-containing protein [Fodinicurvata halophila]|uniref:NUDIX domain-containing protein n=1 Tax=Fodinicurvata halophila TaxID=1419723 RepID=A0ABV8UPH4_9PROT
MIAFDTPDPAYLYTCRPGAYGIAWDDQRRLFLVRTPDGLEIPGGGIEPGETLEQALRREFVEETGYELEGVEPYLSIRQYLTKPLEDKFYDKYPTFFLIALGRRLGPPLESDHEPCWIEPRFARGEMAESGQEWMIEHIVKELLGKSFPEHATGNARSSSFRREGRFTKEGGSHGGAGNPDTSG